MVSVRSVALTMKYIVGRGLNNKFTNNQETKMSIKDTLTNFELSLNVSRVNLTHWDGESSTYLSC